MKPAPGAVLGCAGLFWRQVRLVSIPQDESLIRENVIACISGIVMSGYERHRRSIERGENMFEILLLCMLQNTEKRLSFRVTRGKMFGE